ncbi:hypothetical protein QJS10_CPB04g01711 [Acorus calamus]|uniref:Uncharacterized protein n=1 Tax=Acorus calamus TaxID=4465 RepID=A0AAV9F215_ACOCL|nr:hypothetical protein QJS10_CPB04g01711 [Acorus calamus]
MCLTEGSLGLDCCWKRCVDLKNDSFNCGRCGKYYRPRTCDIFPRMCLTEGSLGPDCCGKRCVDLKNDSFNCGRCGKAVESTDAKAKTNGLSF